MRLLDALSETLLKRITVSELCSGTRKEEEVSRVTRRKRTPIKTSREYGKSITRVCPILLKPRNTQEMTGLIFG